MRVMLRLLPLLLVAWLISACVDSEDGGAPTDTPTASPSPTATATPATTPQPTATLEPGTPTAEPATSTPTPTVTPSTEPSTPSPTAIATVTMRLGVGESGDAGGGWTLRLDAVENDSRCGVDVVCVWAGEATAVITATSPSGQTSEVEIVLSPAEGTASVDELRLRAFDLAPAARSDRPIDPADYSVSLEVTRG